MPGPLVGKYVALGVSGSIACYKAVDLASKLTQDGALVDVLMTPSATRFVTPLTFGAITHRPVVADIFDPKSETSIDHVAVAERADVMIVAPATANTLAKLAWGLADDPVTTTALATKAPIIVAPAMDAHMYDNQATQDNVEKLKSRGYTVAGPASGRLASGLTGRGRLLETQELVGHIRLVLGRDGDLAGRKIVVSAGGTQEAIDPVRFISNHSSGKMGYAVAEAARDRGAEIVLVTASNSLPDPIGAHVRHVVGAREMRDAVVESTEGADVLIMAAAVADWRPVTVASQKLKKGNAQTWAVKLTRTPDILGELRSADMIKVGFAAESQDLIANARAKLESKGLDLIAANDITSSDGGFASENNKVVLLERDGSVEELPLLSKYDVGSRILDRVAARLA